MYRRVRSLLSDPGNRVIALAVVMIVAQLGFRAWIVFGSWFQFDDFAFMSRLMNDPVPEVFFRAYAGHLMPAGFGLQWLNMQVDPLAWWLPAAELLGLQALANSGFLLLLVRAFGVRRGILPPLALYLFSVITVPSFTWWAAGINQLPFQVAIFWGCLTHLAYLRTRQLRWAAATMVVTVGALAFYEKTLLIFVVYAFLAVAYFATGDFFNRIRSVISNYRAGVALYSVVGVTYSAIYAAFALNFAPSRANDTELAPVAWKILLGFVTGLVGGPLRWTYQTEIFAVPNPSDLVAALAAGALALVIWEVIRTFTRSKRAFLLPGLVLAANTLLVGGGRSSFIGSDIALDYRYQTELAALAAIALALATMELRGSPEKVERVRTSVFFDQPARVAVATALCTVLAVLSTTQYVTHWHDARQSRIYFDTVEAELQNADSPVPLVDVHVPGFLMFAFAYPESATSHVLRMFDEQMTFPEYTVDRIFMIADDGTVHPMIVDSVRRARESELECAYQPRVGRTRIPLDGPVTGAGWWVRLAYGSDKATPIVIRAGERRHELDVPSGVHNIFFEVSGDFESIELSGMDHDVKLCVGELELGQPRPASGPYTR